MKQIKALMANSRFSSLSPLFSHTNRAANSQVSSLSVNCSPNNTTESQTQRQNSEHFLYRSNAITLMYSYIVSSRSTDTSDEWFVLDNHFAIELTLNSSYRIFYKLIVIKVIFQSNINLDKN